ncbi:MAG: flagellar hook-basal body complex protein FliE [Planctomycetes bacterium]|nr:flagellar hook-basal body complex protein FliE [Planctomycetota bacterium]
MTPILPIGIEARTPLAGIAKPGAPAADAARSFQSFLLESIDHVNSMQADANRAVEQLAIGGDTDMAEALTSIQKADLAFRMMLQVRNKLVQAYQEINQIRI